MSVSVVSENTEDGVKITLAQPLSIVAPRKGQEQFPGRLKFCFAENLGIRAAA
jgi:hypothetical protein